jgi:integrase
VLVPKAAREKLGKAHLKQSLGTHNLTTANLLKPPVVARFKAQIEEAMREVLPTSGPFEEARAIRAARTKATAAARPFTFTDRLGKDQTVEVEEDDESFYAVERAERLEEELGEDTAVAFAEVALGKATPLLEHLEAFGSDQGYQPKSLLTMRASVRIVSEWLQARGHRQTLEAVTSERGATFMRHLVHERGLSHKSAGKYVSFLRSYWKWLIDHHHLPPGTAPWSSALPKPKTTGRHTDLEPDEGKRPYRAEELKKLLTGKPAEPYVMDLIRLAALTGMRLEELYRLRVRDVVDGFFLVRDGKTANSKRRVPVHPDLKSLVKRLTEGKEPGTYLMEPDAKVLASTGLRSGAASKAFGYYRKSVGVDDRPNGKLKSNIDFHSLRRWFIMSARDALLQGAKGYNQWTIAEVAGHEDGLTDTLKMTLGLYAGASADEALRACVAAVSLPR